MPHFFYHDATASVSQGLIIIEDSRSHSDSPHSVGLLWTSDQPDAETSLPDNTQHSQETDIHAPGGIRTHNRNKRAAADHVLDRAATGIMSYFTMCKNSY